MSNPNIATVDHRARGRRHAHSPSARSMLRPRRVARTAAALLLGAGGLFLLFAGPASAATLDGVATIQTPLSASMTYPAASTAQFTVTLPDQAACSDNSVDGTHVWTYLVPPSTDVATGVTIVNDFPATSPASAGPPGLFDATGTYVGPLNTAISDQITTLPNNFEWGPVVAANPGSLTTLLDNGTTGVWEAGIACANASGVVTDFWNTEVTFTASSSDPNGFTWSAVPGPASSGTTTTTGAGGSTTTTGAGGSTTTTAGAGGTTTTTGAGGTTTTTGAGGTTTTTTGTGGSTTTTGAGGTTTTTAADPSSVNAAATGASGSGTSGGTGSSGTGATGALAFTGMPAPAAKILGAAFLLMGAGLMLLGDPRRRARLLFIRRRQGYRG